MPRKLDETQYSNDRICPKCEELQMAKAGLLEFPRLHCPIGGKNLETEAEIKKKVKCFRKQPIGGKGHSIKYRRHVWDIP